MPVFKGFDTVCSAASGRERFALCSRSMGGHGGSRWPRTMSRRRNGCWQRNRSQFHGWTDSQHAENPQWIMKRCLSGRGSKRTPSSARCLDRMQKMCFRQCCCWGLVKRNNGICRASTLTLSVNKSSSTVKRPNEFSPSRFTRRRNHCLSDSRWRGGLRQGNQSLSVPILVRR